MTYPTPVAHNMDSARRHIFSVSELTDHIKNLLESTYPYVWISGEISNMHRHSSGHCYFTLKDPHSQISAVMFKGQARRLTFRPEDGLSIVAMGRVSVYAPRGSYQIILEFMEPKGVGALLLAYEQLKARLAEEGLFDPGRKRPLPFMPRQICVITSPTGSVIHDILHIVRRRFPSTLIRLIPVAVQGEGAIADIVSAIELANEIRDMDVIILARGGGSIEDLSAFNSEAVARAVFSSRTPIISAVGHETDFTIADFVADLRAPTPSAAAELVVPERESLMLMVSEMRLRLQSAMSRGCLEWKKLVRGFSDRLVHPSRRVQDLRLRLDDLFNRIHRAVIQETARKKQILEWSKNSLSVQNPARLIRNLRQKNRFLYDTLLKIYMYQYSKRLSRLQQARSRLEAVGPLNILTRGYSITRTIPEGQVLRDAAAVKVGQQVSVILANGSLSCLVERIHPNGQTDL